MATITLYTRNILETGTVTVTGTPDTGYPEARLYDRYLNLYWKDTSTEAKTFQIDQSTSNNKNVDFLAIDKHNFNSSTGLKWQHSPTSTAWTDAVTPWNPGDNNQIIKTSTGGTVRYWRLILEEMANPKCSEVFMSYGYSFTALASPHPVGNELSNIQWNRTVGGLERCTKFGDERRLRDYTMFMTSGELTNFRAAMDDLDGYSKPFYIKDHEDDYWMCKLQDVPQEDFDLYNRTHVTIRLLEML